MWSSPLPCPAEMPLVRQLCTSLPSSRQYAALGAGGQGSKAVGWALAGHMCRPWGPNMWAGVGHAEPGVKIAHTAPLATGCVAWREGLA